MMVITTDAIVKLAASISRKYRFSRFALALIGAAGALAAGTCNASRGRPNQYIGRTITSMIPT